MNIIFDFKAFTLDSGWFQSQVSTPGQSSVDTSAFGTDKNPWHAKCRHLEFKCRHQVSTIRFQVSTQGLRILKTQNLLVRGFLCQVSTPVHQVSTLEWSSVDSQNSSVDTWQPSIDTWQPCVDTCSLTALMDLFFWLAEMGFQAPNGYFQCSNGHKPFLEGFWCI